MQARGRLVRRASGMTGPRSEPRKATIARAAKSALRPRSDQNTNSGAVGGRVGDGGHRLDGQDARESVVKLTGSQVIARALKEYGVQYVAGIPGHGAWNMIDALLETGSEIPFLQVMHEQSAVHMADGYYRASGRPMAAMTSIGPGATNTVIGLATSYVDSTAVFLVTGAPSTHMRGHGRDAGDRALPDQQLPAHHRGGNQAALGRDAGGGTAVRHAPRVQHDAERPSRPGAPGGADGRAGGRR